MGITTLRPTKYCHACGGMIDSMAIVCPMCGVMQPSPAGLIESDKRIVPALILCFFLGIFGAHRFYVGKTGTGFLQLVTLGGLGVWTLIDFILIVVGSFKDAEGQRINAWT
jgi:hypothetical protein